MWAFVDWIRTHASHICEIADDGTPRFKDSVVYPRAYYPHDNRYCLGGCWPMAFLFEGALCPLGIPVLDQSTTLQLPDSDPQAGHTQLVLPTISRPDADPDDGAPVLRVLGVQVHRPETHRLAISQRETIAAAPHEALLARLPLVQIPQVDERARGEGIDARLERKVIRISLP